MPRRGPAASECQSTGWRPRTPFRTGLYGRSGWSLRRRHPTRRGGRRERSTRSQKRRSPRPSRRMSIARASRPNYAFAPSRLRLPWSLRCLTPVRALVLPEALVELVGDQPGADHRRGGRPGRERHPAHDLADLEVGVVAVTPRPGAALPGGMVGRLLGCRRPAAPPGAPGSTSCGRRTARRSGSRRPCCRSRPTRAARDGRPRR
jgi:hypothetical protein